MKGGGRESERPGRDRQRKREIEKHNEIERERERRMNEESKEPSPFLVTRGELTSGVVERGLENDASESERVDEKVEKEKSTVRIRANPRL